MKIVGSDKNQDCTENGNPLKWISRHIHETQEAAFILDAVSFRFHDVNKAALKLYGYTAEEFKSMSVFDLLPSSELERMHEDIDIFRGQILYTSNTVHKRHNGEEIKLRVVAKSLLWEGMVAWVVRVTERRRK